MFVPKTGGRTTRRRQRTSSDDSVKPPKAKRQRSVLRRPDESPSDTNLGREIAKLTSSLPNGDSIPTDLANTDSNIASRTMKQSDALGNTEGTIVLVSALISLRVLLKLSSLDANVTRL
jgi:nuclear pore complex protein Nup133